MSHCSTSDAVSEDEGRSGGSSVCEGEAGVSLVSLDPIPKLSHHGSLSSDDNDLDGDEAGPSQNRRGKKTLRQKWVPLDIPENSGPKHPRKKAAYPNTRSYSESDSRKGIVTTKETGPAAQGGGTCHHCLKKMLLNSVGSLNFCLHFTFPFLTRRHEIKRHRWKKTTRSASW